MTKVSNSTQKATISKVSIDSFKLRLPLELANIIDDNLLGTWVYVNDKTGETNPYFDKKNSVTVKVNGITTRYAIEQQVGKNKQVNSYLTMLINSKLLESKYFEGITLENIGEIYKAIIKQKVVLFSISDLLKHSNITDVDFKKDAKIKDFDACINQLRDISKVSKQKDKGYRYFNQKDNRGIEWSTRKTTSFKGNPYLKLYHKELELKNNSTEFSNEYLKGQDYNDIVRIETTIKNNAHFRYLGLPENNLENILSLTDEQKETIIQSALSKHLEARVKDLIDNNELKPMEKVLYSLFMQLLNEGVSFERAKNVSLKLIDNKTQRSRTRKQLDIIYDKHIQGNPNDLKAIQTDKFWNFINW